MFYLWINIVRKCHSWYEDTYMVVLVPVTVLTSTRSAQITLRSPGIEIFSMMSTGTHRAFHYSLELKGTKGTNKLSHGTRTGFIFQKNPDSNKNEEDAQMLFIVVLTEKLQHEQKGFSVLSTVESSTTSMNPWQRPTCAECSQWQSLL